MGNQNYATDNYAADNQTTETATQVRERVSSQSREVRERAQEMKNKVKDQASQLGQQVNDRIDRSRGGAAERLRNTSQRINSMAMYLENHDSRAMSEDLMRVSQETVRRYPAQTLLGGVLLGLFIGRLFR